MIQQQLRQTTHENIRNNSLHSPVKCMRLVVAVNQNLAPEVSVIISVISVFSASRFHCFSPSRPPASLPLRQLSLAFLYPQYPSLNQLLFIVQEIKPSCPLPSALQSFSPATLLPSSLSSTPPGFPLVLPPSKPSFSQLIFHPLNP